MGDGGKGSSRRPVSDQKQFDDNWDKIFGKKKTPPVEDGYEQEERLNRIAEGYDYE